MSPLIVPNRCTIKLLITQLKSGLSWSGFHITFQQPLNVTCLLKFILFCIVETFHIEITFGDVRLHWTWCVISRESYFCYASLLSLFAAPITVTVIVKKHVLQKTSNCWFQQVSQTKAGSLIVILTILLLVMNISHHVLPCFACWPSLKWKQNIVTPHVPPEQCKFHYEVVLISILTFCVFRKQNYQHFGWRWLPPRWQIRS